jgi:nifR3 family TIM-barrel protein
MTNFWKEIANPIIVLAPMEDVTDTVFRELIVSISDPSRLHIVFSEFTSTDGLCHKTGRENVIKRLFIAKQEKELLKKTNTRIVAQIWGADPEKFYQSARMISEELDFDGLDINMGCPVKKIIKQGSCSALIQNPSLAREIIQATIEGSSLPVSVKTRIGFKEISTLEWIGYLLETGLSAITIHGRIQKVMSDGPVYWDEIEKAARLRDPNNPECLIIGNGDVLDIKNAEEKCLEHGLDGIMIGRGVFHNPWLFNPGFVNPSPDQKIALMLEHVDRFVDTWGDERNFDILKRFFKVYISGFNGAAQLRSELMQTKNRDETRAIADRARTS